MPLSTANRDYIECLVVHFGLPTDYVGIVVRAIRQYSARNGHLRPFLEEDLQDVAVDLMLELGRGPWRTARGRAVDSAGADGMRYFKVALRNRLTNFVTRELPEQPDESYDELPTELPADGGEPELPSVAEIERAIRTLGFVDRVVVRYLIEGYSQRDIARITGLSKSRLNRRVLEIRARLSRILQVHR